MSQIKFYPRLKIPSKSIHFEPWYRGNLQSWIHFDTSNSNHSSSYILNYMQTCYSEGVCVYCWLLQLF